MTTYLRVPFAEKDDAKRLGAKWDGDRKRWYVPSGRDLAPFKKWLLPGGLIPNPPPTLEVSFPEQTPAATERPPWEEAEPAPEVVMPEGWGAW